MFDKTKILACGKSLVGFRQDNNAIYDTLYKIAQAVTGQELIFDSATKTITWTGNDFEAESFIIGDSITTTLSTLNNAVKTIALISGNVITTVETLVNETSATAKIQATGDLQTSSSGLYVNDLPAVNFEIIDANLSNDISAKDYLNNIYESELLNLVNQFVNKSKQNYNSKELLSKQSIVSGVASMNNKAVQNERFVGYWLRPHRSDYMKSKIISLGFQATGTQATSLKIFLYETSQLEAIKIFDFPITKDYSLVWQDVTDWILSYESLTGGVGQDYLLGYYEKSFTYPEDWQLQEQALFMQFDCNCPGSPKTIYGKYIGIQPIEINKSNLNWNSGTGTYDIPLVDNIGDFVTTQTYGLVAKINVTCDISDVICQNINLFSKALQHAIAVRVLYDTYASIRINSISDSKRDQSKQFALKYDGILNGYTTPEGSRIKGLIDILTVDFSALDKYCLPCAVGIERGNLIR